VKLGAPPSRALAAVVAWLAFACGSVRLGELDPPDDRQMVVAVVIDGNKALSDATLVEGLGARPDNWTATGDKPLLNRSALPTDARRIESVYADHGYFEARVREYAVEDLEEGLVRVRFRVREGAPTRIAEVRIPDFVDAAGDDEVARARLGELAARAPKLAGLAVGDVWRQADYAEGRDALRQALVDAGFLYAEVVGDVFVVRATHQATVQLQVAPGPLARIAEVRVTGNDRIAEARIRRRVDLAPGDLVLPSRLKATEENVYALRAFFGVSVQAVRRSLDDALGGHEPTFDAIRALDWPRDVVVEIGVQEMPIHTLTGGVGTTLESTRNEVYGRAGYENRDFLGGLRYLDAEVRPALVALPNLWDRGADYAFAAKAGVQLAQPSFLEEYLELSTRLDYELGVAYGYRSHKVLATPALARTFWNRLTLRLAFNALYYRYFDYAGALSLPLADTVGLSFRPEYVLTSLEQLVLLDLRDVIYDPRKGVLASVRVNESAQALGSAFHYVRVMADLRAYLTPWRPVTLALRAAWGQTFNALGSETPLPARFLGGGASDLRGYGEGRMGPYLCQSPDGTTTSGTNDRPCDGKKVFIGGNVMAVASAEVRLRLPYNLGATAFADAGQIWLTRDAIDLAELGVAVGPGLRYDTPFGPLRLDVAWLVTRPNVGAWTFHLSIGQAF